MVYFPKNGAPVVIKAGITCAMVSIRDYGTLILACQYILRSLPLESMQARKS